MVRHQTDFNRNNLDCLRLLLSLIVVLFHVSALTNLPAFALLGQYASPHFAVRSFFVISGLLIYRSYEHSSTLTSYFEKRARRIYPAYFVTIVCTALALSLLSALPPSRYYFSISFWKYFGANLLFLNFLAPTLPGVFTSNSMQAVDGALWTLKIEVCFYAIVPILHYLCNRFGMKLIAGGVFIFSVLWKYGFMWLALIYSTSSTVTSTGSRNIFDKLAVQFPAELVYFMAGVLLLIYFDTLKLHFRGIMVLTALLFLTDHLMARELLDIFWIPGLTFVFGFWRYFGNFSKYGDFSYGTYIVHWPIFQVLIDRGFLRLNPAIFLALSLSLIGLTSVLMWKFVESKFLARNNHYRHATLGTAK